MFPQVLRAGEWFLRSGIQSADGGVARYYRSDRGAFAPVSTEITGYAASTLVFLHALTGDARYLERAQAAAWFLARAWQGAMPFEVSPARFTYFFDCGIIVRGLLAVWRATQAPELLHCARAVGDSMAVDFHAGGGEFHPILTLPEKRPAERDPLRWSRLPGCYQLKAALGWWELGEATGDQAYRDAYRCLLAECLRTAPDFLPGDADRRKVVDRLHAYLYFLEGLLPVAEEAPARAALAEGMARVAHWRCRMAPQFERADVYAQLLRVRHFAGAADGAAREECDLLRQFAIASEDSRLHGGFYFGRSGALWEPYANPVSTAFSLQALAYEGGAARPERLALV